MKTETIELEYGIKCECIVQENWGNAFIDDRGDLEPLEVDYEVELHSVFIDELNVSEYVLNYKKLYVNKKDEVFYNGKKVDERIGVISNEQLSWSILEQMCFDKLNEN